MHRDFPDSHVNPIPQPARAILTGAGIIVVVASGFALLVWSPWDSEEERCAARVRSLVEQYAAAYVHRDYANLADVLARAEKARIRLPKQCVKLAIECRTPGTSPGVFYDGAVVSCRYALDDCVQQSVSVDNLCTS
jgi:hypothetical protein